MPEAMLKAKQQEGNSDCLQKNIPQNQVNKYINICCNRAIPHEAIKHSEVLRELSLKQPAWGRAEWATLCDSIYMRYLK